MKPYLQTAFLMEIFAAMMLMISLILPWHAEHGSGLEVLGLAIETTVPMGLAGSEASEIPISQWWLVWIIPSVAIVMGIRAAVGFTLPERGTGHRLIFQFLVIPMLLVCLWYLFASGEHIETSYWLVMSSAGLLILVYLLEFTIPEDQPSHLPPDHPDRIEAGDYVLCRQCGEFNVPETRTCRSCGAPIYPD